MKVNLPQSMIDEIVNETILRDISSLRKRNRSLIKEIEYNPEYLANTQHDIHYEYQDNLEFLQSLTTVAEYYIGVKWEEKLFELEQDDNLLNQ